MGGADAPPFEFLEIRGGLMTVIQGCAGGLVLHDRSHYRRLLCALGTSREVCLRVRLSV